MAELPSLPGVEHEWIDAGGLRTHVALAGDPAAPPVLLVHGWPQHWWCWRYVIPALAETHRVIAADLRGHGWTDAPRGGYAKEQLADDLLALLDAMGIEKVTWVGHDWGAWAGFLAALRAPGRFERLVASAIPPPFARQRDPKLALTLLSYQVPISLPLVGRALARAGGAGAILRRARLRGDYTAEEIRIYDEVFRARPHVTVAMYRTFLLREMPGIVRGRYAHAALRVPTTLLLGDRDLITRSVTAEAYPGLDVVRLDRVGHFVPEEAPEALLAAISTA